MQTKQINSNTKENTAYEGMEKITKENQNIKHSFFTEKPNYKSPKQIL